VRIEEAQALKKLLATVEEQGKRLAALEKRLAEEAKKPGRPKKDSHAQND
jgi:hypothetical protein